MPKMNRECMTFEEWICAAGYVQHDPFVVTQMERYPVKVRKAWRAGEDPTEHRANPLK